LDVMTVLWDLESGTVAQVKAKLKDKLAYTTVLTVLRTLEQKGYVKHEEDGRAHRYLPTIKRESAGTSALKRLVGTVVPGAPELLMTQLVSEHNLSAAEIKRLRKLLEERLREAKP